ncbi:MAG: hypothetical protein HYR67_09520 [Bacteroidetes bacterium]|nr:hypothetical protein [Bacteroidota bacterium]
MDRIIVIFLVLLISGYSCYSQDTKKRIKKDSENIDAFVKKISKELTTDKSIAESKNKKNLKTLTLYYDPKATLSAAKNDLLIYSR